MPGNTARGIVPRCWCNCFASELTVIWGCLLPLLLDLCCTWARQVQQEREGRYPVFPDHPVCGYSRRSPPTQRIRRAGVEESRFAVSPVWAAGGPSGPTPEIVAATRPAHWLNEQSFQTPSDNELARGDIRCNARQSGFSRESGGCSRNWSGEVTRTAHWHPSRPGGMDQVVTCQYGIAGLHPPRSGQKPVTEVPASPTPPVRLGWLAIGGGVNEKMH
jgi:hypothetical protein